MDRKNATGQDIFDVAQLDQNFTNPIPGDLAFSDSRNVVMTYHHSGGGVTTTWRKFRDIIPTTETFHIQMQINRGGEPTSTLLVTLYSSKQELIEFFGHKTRERQMPWYYPMSEQFIEDMLSILKRAIIPPIFFRPLFPPNYNKPNFNFSARRIIRIQVATRPPALTGAVKVLAVLKST